MLWFIKNKKSCFVKGGGLFSRFSEGKTAAIAETDNSTGFLLFSGLVKWMDDERIKKDRQKRFRGKFTRAGIRISGKSFRYDGGSAGQRLAVLERQVAKSKEMSIQKIPKTRSLRDGDWYWVHKQIVQELVPEIGTTGLTVYSFLASMTGADQRCFPSQKYVGERLGLSRSTVCRTLQVLEGEGLIRKERVGRSRCAYLLLACGSRAGDAGVSRRRNRGVSEAHTNDKTIKRINNNIDKGNFPVTKEFRPQTRQEALALDLAVALDDLAGLPLYITFAKKYPESFLRQVLGEVREIPREKIRKSRGALFNHMVRERAEKPRPS